jgi:hypothetical protein
MRVVQGLRRLPGQMVSQVLPEFQTPSVLIAEGSLPFGQAFLKKMPKSEDAYWVKRVVSTRPFIGVDQFGGYLFLDLSKCKIALIDAQVDGHVRGAKLARALIRRFGGRILCVGISWSEDVNQQLGAHFGIVKGALLAGLMEKLISLEDLLQGRSSPELLREKIEALQEKFKYEREFRHKGGNLVMELIHGEDGGSET